MKDLIHATAARPASVLVVLLLVSALAAGCAVAPAGQPGSPAAVPGAEQTAFVDPMAAALTPVPDRGVRVGLIHQIEVDPRVALTSSFVSPDLGDVSLVAGLLISRAGRTIGTIDLNSGQAAFHTPFVPPDQTVPWELQISGRFLAWLEPTGTLRDPRGLLKLYDLAQSRELTIGPERRLPRHLDFKGNILVWSEIRNDRYGLFGYNLQTQAEFVLAGGDTRAGLARVCSDQWAIYLQNWNTNSGREEADLIAENLVTHEVRKVASIPITDEVYAGQQHACDGSIVAWITWPAGTWSSWSGFEQHVYDLNSRHERALDMPPWHVQVPRLRLDGQILIGTAGYDLERDVAFALPPQFGTPLVSNERLLWIEYRGKPYAAKLYTASIIRDPR